MLQVRRTFEGEKHQLQELNNRLAQYLSRTKQLEHENAHLITEINKIRQTKTAQREHKYKDEVRELRRMVGQLSFEKSRAEMEREQLWREFQMIQSLRREETDTCKGVDGDLKSCEKELQGAHQHNGALEQRLFQLEGEYKHLEDAHRQQIAHLRDQVDARRMMMPDVVVTQTYHRGPPAAVSLEDHVQECAQTLSEGWIDTFEMYQRKVEEMEQAIRDDQARLDDLQREKMLHASEFNKLRAEVEQQSNMQMHLEGQLVNMQDNFRRDFNHYQMIIEELENERNMLADSIANKMRDYQHLLQVKMDLGMEVAAYRALLEGERVDMQEVNRRVNQHQRERIIDIKLPSQAYQPRASTSTRQQVHTSNLRGPPVPRSGTISPSRIIPIAVTGRALHQGSPASRRDMVSFTKAQAAASAATAVDKTMAQNQNRNDEGPQKEEAPERIVKITAASSQQPVIKDTFSPITSPTAEPKVRVVSPPMMGFNRNTEADAKSKVGDKPEDVRDVKGQGSAKPKVDPGEKKPLDSPMVQEIIKNVMKPAGMDSAFSLSGDSPQMTYHVEKIEQADGTTKTQIVLESKVEEEVDISEDSALEELLSRGVKKVSLEDIKGTATGNMIQNLLSGLQGAEDMVNKSVNVEIIEEPVDSQSDEEYEAEERSLPGFFPASSAVFQIEELENVPHDSKSQKSGGDATKSSEANRGFVRVHESSRENVSPYFSHDQDEYFVSTPDENLSEPEDVGGITSYGHYGMVDDLSDERYYQDEGFPTETNDADDEYKFMTGDHSFGRESSIPECIIEEEVHVSPTVQESMLEMFKADSALDPKQQLKGALEKIQGSVSGSLKDELAFLTKVSGDSSQNVRVRTVSQSSDHGTTTIIAELSVSETLQESGLLDADDDELSDEQIMAALRSSHPGLQMAEGGYSMKISKHEDVAHTGGLEAESVPEISEKHIQLGPSEAQSFTFQMDMNNGQAQASSERVLQSHTVDGAPLKISHEKRVATVYLDSSTDE